LGGAIAVGGLAYGASLPAAANKPARPTVSVASNPKLGRILVGPNGHTLYLYEGDTGTMSACRGGCATVWPALTTSGSPHAGAGVTAAKLRTVNGQAAHQVVYNGHLLYYFLGDKKPGQTTGLRVPHWDTVSPTGNKIEVGGH
jgi:predicted lipoprotein with Yx(FWY)xxD motif